MKKGIKINREQKEIFDFVTDYRNVNFLLDEFLHFEPDFSGAIRLGERYRARGGFANVRFTTPYYVTAYTPDQLMTLKSQEILQSQVSWEVRPATNGTNFLCLQVELDLDTSHSPVFRPFLSLPSFVSNRIRKVIVEKQQNLISNALLKAKNSLENRKLVVAR